MSSQRKLRGTSLLLGLIFILSTAAFAQQSSPAPQQEGGTQQQPLGRRKGMRHGPGKRGHGGVLRLMSRLNLTDAQQQQLRAIEERFEASIKPQREEMRRLFESSQGTPLSADAEARARALRAEMGQAMRGMREEMQNVLTSEQRAQLEQLVKERKALHQERRGRRLNRQNDDQ
ncbi:MAG TPA: Spy/CpxP family protein refolding chaperone [Pyrinomonadaceae bacterium]